MSDWINETLGEKSNRDTIFDVFMNTLNTARADGFCDVEAYHLMFGFHGEKWYWPLWDYWCEIFLDWDDEVAVHDG